MKRIFKRKIYSRLLEWKKENNGKTALLIKGARRVGKSTIAEEFAKKEYRSYIVVDFADAPAALWEAVRNISDRDYFFTQLQYNTTGKVNLKQVGYHALGGAVIASTGIVKSLGVWIQSIF